MRAWDYDAVTYDGEIYCNDCLPDGVDMELVNPIFASAKWHDHIPTCRACGCRHTYMSILIGRPKFVSKIWEDDDAYYFRLAESVAPFGEVLRVSKMDPACYKWVKMAVPQDGEDRDVMWIDLNVVFQEVAAHTIN